MNKPIPPELIIEIERLDEENVVRVVAYAKSLGSEDALAARNEKLRKYINGDNDAAKKIELVPELLLPTIVIGEMAYGARESAHCEENL